MTDINNVNLTTLVSSVAEVTGDTKKATEAAVRATLAVISDALAAGADVRLTGFGSFSVRERAAREGRNPSTGEPLSIPASKGVGFKASKNLRASVNGEVSTDE